MDVRVGMWRRLSAEELMLLNCGVGEDSSESLGLQRDQTGQFKRKSVLNIHWKDWSWSWNSNIMATWYEELIYLKRPWCWERLRTGGEGDARGWDGWMASLTQWTQVRVGSGTSCWTGRPGVLQLMGLQRLGHNWATELNWIEVLHLWMQKYSQSDFDIDHLVMSMCRVFSCVVARGCLLPPVHSWQNSVSLLPALFCTPRPNLSVSPAICWLSTFTFQSPMMKRIYICI